MNRSTYDHPSLPYQSEVMWVTPELAEKWLGNNTSNRNTRARIVARYAADMAASNWLFTGEAIKFDWTGKLTDGQHRLLAIIESGISGVWMLVMWNLDPAAQDVMDTGAKRLASDMLTMHGHADTALSAAAAKWAILYDEDRLYVDHIRQQVTHSDILVFTSSTPGWAAAVRFAGSIRRQIMMPPSLLVACVYITSKVDVEASHDFFSRLADGVGLPEGSPVLALRARLSEIKAGRRRVEGQAYLSITVRAWNHWRAGNSLTSIPIYKSSRLIRCPEPK